MRSFPKNRLLNDRRGTAAIEFAIVGPVFMMCMVGIVYVAMMLFCEASLQYAVEQSSRCAAVNATLCGSLGATQTYAAQVYYGPTVAPTFVATNQLCGFQVAGSATMTINWVFGHADVPLTATACFP